MNFQNHQVDELDILKKRAKQLAVETESEENFSDRFEITAFTLNDEQYAFESRFIREVHKLTQYTKLPCTPDFVFGIMNIRSKIITIIDIRRFFDMEAHEISGSEKVIILQNGTYEMGVLVDSIQGVSMVSLHSIEVRLPTVTDTKAEYLLGIAHKSLVVLDGEKLLQSSKVIVNEEV